MMSRGADALTAHQRALQLMDLQLLGQASVIAYSKIYIIAAALMFVLIPLLLLVPKPAASEGSEHMVME
jgi:DHA2 family multidrug resistance protein